MIPTPDLSHLTRDDFERVYEPAEDTFLLLDALEQDAELLRRAAPKICLEVGSGSGCVSTFVAQILPPASCLYLAADLNPHACGCTRRTALRNSVSVDPILTSLAASLLPRIRHAVDILLFNPPYVPTDAVEADDAQTTAGISGSWAGGRTGMQITDVLLDQVDDLLSADGRFYLVALKQNDVPEIRARMLDRFTLHSEIVIQRRAGREHLFILRFSRTA